MRRSNIMCMFLLLLSIGSTAEEIIDQVPVEALETNSELTQTEEELFEDILEDKSRQLQEQLNAENKNLQALLLKAEESLIDTVTSKQKEIDDLQQSLTELEDESRQLQEQLNAENKNLQALLLKAEESLVDTVTSKQKEIDSRQKKIDGLKQSLTKLKSANSDLQSLLAEKVRSITIEQERTRCAYKEIEQFWHQSIAFTALLSSGVTIAVMKIFF